jgi:outer membrane lipoprotein SlyB
VFADDSTLVIDGITGQLFGTLHGNVTGNITGDVLGDLTGDVTGNVLGDVIGDVTGNVSGNLTGLVRTAPNNTFVDVNNIENRINTFDYGVINPVFVDPISYFLYVVGTDMGTFNNPSEFGIDAGSINGE